MSFAFFPPLRRPRPLEKLQRVILKRRGKQGERDGRRVWGGSLVGKGSRREMGVVGSKKKDELTPPPPPSSPLSPSPSFRPSSTSTLSEQNSNHTHSSMDNQKPRPHWFHFRPPVSFLSTWSRVLPFHLPHPLEEGQVYSSSANAKKRKERGYVWVRVAVAVVEKALR